MTKSEVCEYLGKSARSVTDYVSAGKLPARYVNGANGRSAVFDRTEVEAFKSSLETPVVKAVATVEPHAVSPPAVSNDSFAGFADRLERLTRISAAISPAAPEPKCWLTLAEACAYTGLSASFLRRQAEGGAPFVINEGSEKQKRFRFCRAMLPTLGQ